MMFVVRSDATAPAPSLPVKMMRETPTSAADRVGTRDYFCTGTAEDMAALRAAASQLIELRDGWYADDTGGGVAIWGQGRYWEVRDTPFSVKESCAAEQSAAAAPAAEGGGEQVNVRGAVFGV